MGKPNSPEARAKISAALKGRIMSPEWRAKLSASHLGNTYALGHHPSEEARAKMSIGGKERVWTSEMRARVSVALWKGGLAVSAAKTNARRRGLGHVCLNSWFTGCDSHHINPQDVIHMPRKLHQSIYHNQRTGKGMAEMNALAGQFLTEDWT